MRLLDPPALRFHRFMLLSCWFGWVSWIGFSTLDGVTAIRFCTAAFNRFQPSALLLVCFLPASPPHSISCMVGFGFITSFHLPLHSSYKRLQVVSCVVLAVYFPALIRLDRLWVSWIGFNSGLFFFRVGSFLASFHRFYLLHCLATLLH